MSLLKKVLFAAAAMGLFAGIADAQVPSGIDALIERAATPNIAPEVRVSDADATALRSALAAARTGDRGRFDSAVSQIGDPEARKLATWAYVDASGEQMSFFELDQARRDLAGWPRQGRRLELTEKKLTDAGLSPQAVIDFFGMDTPQTGDGAMALGGAYLALGRKEEGEATIRLAWRTQLLEADAQKAALARFGSILTQEDHIKRADMILYGPQGPAARDMLPLLPADWRALAQARISVRNGQMAAVTSVPANLQDDPGLAFERIARLRRADQDAQALALASKLGPAPGFEAGDAKVYTERRNLFVEALKEQNYRAAYDSMNNNGFASGSRKAEAEFFAGWVALTKLNNPKDALLHFEGVKAAGRTPLTQGRALYWLGRAEEALGDHNAAQAYYEEGSKYIGAFYGQLAAEKAGIKTITLPPEPRPTDADRARFEGRPGVRAARILAQIGEKPLFNAFVQQIDDTLPTIEEYALLMDMTRDYGENFTAMMVGRAAAGKGFLMPERMYPIRAVPNVPGAPDPAFVLAITRQESSFDPKIRSSADARGMMMLLPSTARGVAKRLGVSYVESQLWDADYNMQLGTFHLGELMNTSSGSFLLTAVGYNAGPGRMSQWTPYCGDPRGGTSDPLDFIECVPFTETRDYMMRVLENVQVYRARLNGGTATIAPMADLKRGGYNMVAGN